MTRALGRGRMGWNEEQDISLEVQTTDAVKTDFMQSSMAFKLKHGQSFTSSLHSGSPGTQARLGAFAEFRRAFSVPPPTNYASSISLKGRYSFPMGLVKSASLVTSGATRGVYSYGA
ncbi:unnamed protein product [Prorocentrum cordatum]|uniref:Uncharacterized protein n=1 Tax=Prorocentrum cordatum TaxID=2364126 RepID=A0ABN9V127_9DINO|nr:unnamed protein product [Polarella glacialis]